MTAFDPFDYPEPPEVLTQLSEDFKQAMDDSQLGPPTMGDHEDEARREVAYGLENAQEIDEWEREGRGW